MIQDCGILLMKPLFCMDRCKQINNIFECVLVFDTLVNLLQEVKEDTTQPPLVILTLPTQTIGPRIIRPQKSSDVVKEKELHSRGSFVRPLEGTTGDSRDQGTTGGSRDQGTTGGSRDQGTGGFPREQDKKQEDKISKEIKIIISNLKSPM